MRFKRKAGRQVDFGLLALADQKYSRSSPGVPEQRRIVTELDALQAQMDALKKLQSDTAAELDALLPSILDKAFTGNL